jgi:hypothetical protein
MQFDAQSVAIVSMKYWRKPFRTQFEQGIFKTFSIKAGPKVSIGPAQRFERKGIEG